MQSAMLLTCGSRSGVRREVPYFHAYSVRGKQSDSASFSYGI